MFEMRGVWGVQDPHKARGTFHMKEKCKLGGLTFYRFTYVITLPLLHLLLRVRLLWFVCARTRRFWQNSIDLVPRTRRFWQNKIAGFDIILLVVYLIHSAHSIIIRLSFVKNILNHSTHIIDECIFCAICWLSA